MRVLSDIQWINGRLVTGRVDVLQSSADFLCCFAHDGTAQLQRDNVTLADSFGFDFITVETDRRSDAVEALAPVCDTYLNLAAFAVLDQIASLI